MKKHLFAIFTYFVTFFLSFFLVSLLSEKPQTKATHCFPGKNVMRPAQIFETEQQSQIKNLLTRDRNFGLEYFAGTENAKETENLVKRMKTLDDPNLPQTVRKAYKAHTEAWEIYAKHLKKYGKHDDSDKDCINLNRDINVTYDTLLLAAENYGVDFPY